MAEETQVHPGSFVGDSIEEFKKLPVWGKFLALGAVGLAAYLGYSAYKNGQSSQTAQGAAAGTAGTAAGSQSPFSSVNGLPLLPGNVNPVYDPNGNLVGYQQGSTGSSTPTAPTPNPGGTPAPGGTPKPTDPTWYYQKGGITYHAWHGADGRIWGNTGPNTPQVLLSGPPPAKAPPPKGPVPKGPPTKATGSGPASMIMLMHNPLVYWASATPHKPASMP